MTKKELNDLKREHTAQPGVNIMSTISDRFEINGMHCFIETTDGGVAESHASLYVEVDGRVITDSFGYCSPLYAAYNGRDGWKLARLHGSARQSMIRKILKDAVWAEIEAHVDYCQEISTADVIDRLNAKTT